MTKLNQLLTKQLFLTILILIRINCHLSATNIASNDSLFYNSQADSTLITYLQQEYNISISKQNRTKLLTSGENKFMKLFQDIKEAQHHIHLEYFNFRNDSIANALFELLGEKAEEGVEIRAIFDAFGNSSNNQPLKKEHLKAIQGKGIEIIKFDPLKFPWINHVFHRDHRKIAIIDGKIGYTGGMNIADYYINGLPEIGEWRDTHIRIEGEAVNDLQGIFLDMWNKASKQNICGEKYYPYLQDSLEIQEFDESIAIVDRYPKKTPEIMRRVYAKAIESAKEKIQIINPYFTPTSSVKKAIKKAIKKGVKVEIMIPGKSDIPFTPDAAMYIANKLRKTGADIYIFNGGFHHSKIMMVDSLYCTVGSTNLNSRSLRYDYEVNAFVFDTETTNELMEIFKEDQKNSTLLTEEMYKDRSAWKKFLGWFAHLFTPFL